MGFPFNLLLSSGCQPAVLYVYCQAGTCLSPGELSVEPKPDFQEIYNDYYPKLVRYLTRLAGEADAEDLTQETMVKISSGLDGFRGDSTLSTWIYRIATNVARDRFRSAAFKADAVTDQADEEKLSARLDSGSPVESLDTITLRREMNT